MNAHDRLDEIEARANAASKGPWRVGAEGSEGSRVNPNTGDKRTDVRALLICHGRVQPEDGQNAAFIAHAREDVPQLVAALRAVLAECDQVRDAHERHRFVHADTIRNTIESALGGA